jgi:excinuclease UvrABC nuclease subunit
MADTVVWAGKHQFSVHRHTDNWNAVAGIYMFCGINQEGQWSPLYIGQAESLSQRIPNHERWPEAAQLGATHIHALVVPHGATRTEVEAELIRAYQPRLNIRLK